MAYQRKKLINLFFIILGVGILLILLKYKSTPSEENNTATPDQFITGIPQKEFINEVKPSEADAIKKCFPKYAQSSIKELKNNLIEEYNLPEATEESEEYRLIGPNREDYRIHYFKDENPNEALKIYLVGTDEMPDLIKNYPHAQSANMNERLEGALKLGTLQHKIIKMKSQKAEGQVLNFEEEANEITSLRFVNQQSELLCDQTTCRCNQY